MDSQKSNPSGPSSLDGESQQPDSTSDTIMKEVHPEPSFYDMLHSDGIEFMIPPTPHNSLADSKESTPLSEQFSPFDTSYYDPYLHPNAKRNQTPHSDLISAQIPSSSGVSTPTDIEEPGDEATADNVVSEAIEAMGDFGLSEVEDQDDEDEEAEDDGISDEEVELSHYNHFTLEDLGLEKPVGQDVVGDGMT
jgi:hypothetical protein